MENNILHEVNNNSDSQIKQVDSDPLSIQPVEPEFFVQSIDASPKEDTDDISDSSLHRAPAIKTISLIKSFITNFVPFVLGVILTVLFCYYFLPGFKPGSFFQRLFLPEGRPTYESTSVPVLALFLFLWSVIDVLTILIFIYLENRSLLRNLDILPHGNANFSPDDDIDLKWQGSKSGRSFRRMFSLLEFLAPSKSHQNVYEFFRYQSDLDSEKALSKYTLTKIAIWTMPILGFIGTVLGIGLAVGHFSAFLNTNIDDIAQVKSELAKVATGLSYAFFSTLFGLALSMLMMFISTYVQNFEEKYLTQLEETCFSMIQKYEKQNIVPSEAIRPVTQLAPLDYIIEKFTSVLDEKVKSVSTNMEALIKKFDASVTSISGEFSKIPDLEKFSTQVTSTISSVSSKIDRSVSNVSKSIESFGVRLEDSSTKISAEFEKIPDLLEVNNTNFKLSIDNVSSRIDDVVKSVSSNATSIASQLEISSMNISGEFAKIPDFLAKNNQQFELAISNVSGSFSSSIQTFNHQLISVEQNVTSLMSQFENSANNISNAFAKVSHLLEENNKQFDEIIRLVSDRLEVMKKDFIALSTESEKMYNTDLAPVLASLTESQMELLPVLKQLSQPIVISHVLASDNGR